jgi:hypothetical protein
MRSLLCSLVLHELALCGLSMYVLLIVVCPFVLFSLGHCVVCSSSIYSFWLPLWYLQTLLIKFEMIWFRARFKSWTRIAQTEWGKDHEVLTTSGTYPWSQTRSWTGKGRPHSNLIFLREPHIPITIFCLASFKVSVFDLSCVEAKKDQIHRTGTEKSSKICAQLHRPNTRLCHKYGKIFKMGKPWRS